MRYWPAWIACGLLVSLPAAAQADIFRWDNGELIPGTEGITPGPGVGFDYCPWTCLPRDLRFADFSGGLDLTEANFYPTWLDNSRFNGANLTGARLASASLRNADLSGTNLTNASLYGANLTNADLSGANLTDAELPYATLTNANFAGAVVAGAEFRGAWAGTGITLPQLYSTASYQQRNLRGIQFDGDDLTSGDFSGQDLTGARFSATLTNANFSFADLRGAMGVAIESPQLARNTIREFGAIHGLDLAAGETLVVRDSDIDITVTHSMHAVSGGTLELVLGDADWGSTMAVAAAAVTPDLGGTLRVRFADQANLAPLLGTTFDFFDWPAVLDTNNRFDAIELPPGTQWDLTQLYVTGTATLTFIPVPTGDYNRDGTVDAADYVVWRKGLGTTYTQDDYDVWRANFGQTAGGGAAGYPLGASTVPLPAVPEPSTALIAFVGSLALAARCGRTHVGLRRKN
jgi:hypothetical protein